MHAYASPAATAPSKARYTGKAPRGKIPYVDMAFESQPTTTMSGSSLFIRCMCIPAEVMSFTLLLIPTLIPSRT